MLRFMHMYAFATATWCMGIIASPLTVLSLSVAGMQPMGAAIAGTGQE
jgi:hypothetical protein